MGMSERGRDFKYKNFNNVNILILCIFIIQMFSFWVLKPLTELFSNILELKSLTLILLFTFIFLFTNQPDFDDMP